jgi:prenyltransferase beta subunit
MPPPAQQADQGLLSMSRRLQMLQVARLAGRSLGESLPLVADYLASTAVASGGFANRDGRADLYYTPFAIDALIAVDAWQPEGHHARSTRRWLEGFADGVRLDFVHRCCLARAWSAWPAASCEESRLRALATQIASHRAADGSFHTRAGMPRGSAYGSFLAVNAHADLRQSLPAGSAAAITASLANLRTADGGWANEPGSRHGSTTATAAAMATLRSLEAPVPTEAADWLLSRLHPEGGFVASADTPLPDLLSTAVALHALDAVEAPWRDHRERVLDFLDTLWTAEGGFHGSWADDHPDAEYTFYGLVALGHASV